eukprot:gnl/Spiro4/10799_TR5750_c0_g1_i1.p1 gnl/Spiro4/10799_TR5750_c0_g1~~gnl/Spiro4/10799_TR5750_c0_g1_i1.p1  ORF type:complete len:1379 (+),score=435.33 gnl/Spiro4/10799_TR5750_c0_g1_i1:72-4208(+)
MSARQWECAICTFLNDEVICPRCHPRGDTTRRCTCAGARPAQCACCDTPRGAAFDPASQQLPPPAPPASAPPARHHAAPAVPVATAPAIDVRHESMETSSPLAFECTAELQLDPTLLQPAVSAAASGSTTSPSCVTKKFCRCVVRLPEALATTVRENRVLLVVVADRSGSMAGRAWTQVQEAICDMVGQALDNPNLTVEIVLYNNVANLLAFTPDNYETVVRAESARNQTCFAAAFDMLLNVIRRHEATHHEFVVVFMTDGNDTSTRPCEAARIELERTLKAMSKPSTIHVIGFTSEHNPVFLDAVRKSALREGVFRYAEAGDAPDALRMKFAEIFDFVAHGGGTVHVTVTLPPPFVFADSLTRRSTDARAQVTRQVGLPVGGAAIPTVVFEAWVAEGSAPPSAYAVVPPPADTLHLSVHLSETSHGMARTVMVQTLLVHFTPFELTNHAEKILFQLRYASQAVDELAEDAISWSGSGRGSADLATFTDQLSQFQKLIDGVNVFNPRGAEAVRSAAERPPVPRGQRHSSSITREVRVSILEVKSEIQAKLNGVHRFLADLKRAGGAQSVAVLARANDIRYSGQLSKARRQRVMDQRVVQNSKFAQNLAQRLAAQHRTIDLNAVRAQMERAPEASDFYCCTLSFIDVPDALADEQGELLGFGLAVQRPEFAIDDPTQLSVHTVSSTIFAKSAIEDAIKHSIEVRTDAHAHGGFGRMNELGVALRGRGREPINAWLPLYVHPQHWSRVKILLPSILGFFCTLDPLGFAASQYNVLPMILGIVVGRLGPEPPGERELHLTVSLARTCRAVLLECNQLENAVTLSRAFAASPAGRTKDKLSNLFVLVGYMIALPAKARRAVLLGDAPNTTPADEAKAMDAAWTGFWRAFVEETLRRSMHGVLMESSDAVLLGIADVLVRGGAAPDTATVADAPPPAATAPVAPAPAAAKAEPRPKGAPAPPDPDLAVLRCRPTDCFGNLRFDPARFLPPIPQNGRHGKSIDKAQANVAKHHFGLLTGPGKDLKLNNATNLVETAFSGPNTTGQWEERLLAGCVPPQQLDVHTLCLDSVVERLQAQMDLAGSPSLCSVRSAVSFLRVWAHQIDTSADSDTDPAAAAVDNNCGLCPAEWLTQIKQIFSEFLAAAPTSPNTTFRELLSFVRMVHGQDPDLRQDALILRAMLCQAVMCHANRRACTAIEKGTYHDVCRPEYPERVLQQLFEHIKQLIVSSFKGRVLKAKGEWANRQMLETPDLWAFVGWMMSAYSDRGAEFKELVAMFQDPSLSIPLRVDKLRIMLTGQFNSHPVLALGNAWLPEAEHRARFSRAIGADAWLELEAQLRACSTEHAYRASDIPNRHGHCNSNPLWACTCHDHSDPTANNKHKRCKK